MFKENLAGFSDHVGLCRDGLENSTDLFSAAKKLLWGGRCYVGSGRTPVCQLHVAPILLLKHRIVEIKSQATILGAFCLCKSHPIEVSRWDEEGGGTRS